MYTQSSEQTAHLGSVCARLFAVVLCRLSAAVCLAQETCCISPQGKQIAARCKWSSEKSSLTVCCWSIGLLYCRHCPLLQVT